VQYQVTRLHVGHRGPMAERTVGRGLLRSPQDVGAPFGLVCLALVHPPVGHEPSCPYSDGPIRSQHSSGSGEGLSLAAQQLVEPRYQLLSLGWREPALFVLAEDLGGVIR
jgi:hypothetical protein